MKMKSASSSTKIFNLVSATVCMIVLYYSCLVPTLMARLELGMIPELVIAIVLALSSFLFLSFFYDAIFRGIRRLNEWLWERSLRLNEKDKRIILCGFSLLFVIVYLVRCFDSTFWFDEAFGITYYAQPSFREVLKYALWEKTMPPLYNYFINALSHVLGQKTFVYHFSALIPIIIILLINIFEITQRYGYIVSMELCFFLGLSTPLTHYAVEVRSYSWSMLFVFLCGYSAICFLQEERKSHKVLFVISGILSAYTHYFALVAVCSIYLVLLLHILLVKKNRNKLGFFFYAVFFSIISYLPWAVVFLRSVKEISDYSPHGNIDMNVFVVIWHCFSLFVGERGIVFWSLLLCTLMFQGLFGKKDNKHGKEVCILLMPSFIVAIFGITYNKMVHMNVFIPKYLAPTSVLVILIFAILFASTQYRYLMASFIMALSIVLFTPHYIENVRREQINHKMTQESLHTISECVDDNTVYLVDDDCWPQLLSTVYLHRPSELYEEQKAFDYIKGGKKVLYFCFRGDEGEKKADKDIGIDMQKLAELFLLEKDYDLYEVKIR
ncbi:MAG: hypothetical protein K6F35_09445 [Lachnospiraceae bacterium]|nr:hypothetical protein [Lachnospiraceae bacterium]